jgi:HK97 family phage major capsid protein
VLGGWIGEGADLTATKPALGSLTCKANKLTALVPLTDELLEDVPAMTKWLQTKVPEKFNSLINDAIVSGSGAGQPQGLLNAPAKITQAAESGQGAGTIVAKNILKMWGRMYGAAPQHAVWIINQDCEQQLQQLTMPGTNPSPAGVHAAGRLQPVAVRDAAGPADHRRRGLQARSAPRATSSSPASPSTSR